MLAPTSLASLLAAVVFAASSESVPTSMGTVTETHLRAINEMRVL